MTLVDFLEPGSQFQQEFLLIAEPNCCIATTVCLYTKIEGVPKHCLCRIVSHLDQQVLPLQFWLVAPALFCLKSMLASAQDVSAGL